MANTAHESRSPEEREFWDRRFDGPVDVVPGEPIPEPVLGRGAERRARLVARRIGDEVEPGLPSDLVPAAPEPLTEPGPPSAPPGPRPVPRPEAPVVDTPWARALEWLRDRRGDPRLGVVALIAIAVVAGFVWYRIGLAGGSDAPPTATRSTASAAATPTTAGSAADADPTGASGGSSARATVMVHVAGAVARPGVVELAKSARVIDALEAVGGATLDGDVDRLNLAAPVVDGARVYVPRRGEADPGVVADGTAGGDTERGAPVGKVNLNTATQEQLEALPGIGPTYAQAIIAERTRRNGFASVNELREVRGIGEKRFADLAPLVTV